MTAKPDEHARSASGTADEGAGHHVTFARERSGRIPPEGPGQGSQDGQDPFSGGGRVPPDAGFASARGPADRRRGLRGNDELGAVRTVEDLDGERRLPATLEA